MLPWGLGGKESTCNVEAAGDAGSIPGSGRSPGEGNGNPLQYSCLENPWTEELQTTVLGYRPQVCKDSDTTDET